MNYTKKLVLLITLLQTSFITQCCDITKSEKPPISVRLATLDDMQQINAISVKQYHNDFKPMWINFYVPTFNLTENPEETILRIIQANEKNNREFIANQENNRLLVAELTTSDQPKKIAGFCRFEKKSDQVMYMHFILVDEDLRKQGIARHLAHSAMNTWPDVKELQFRAMVCNKAINDLYLTFGCTQKGTVSLHPHYPGKIFTEPDAPITHYNYSYMIKK